MKNLRYILSVLLLLACIVGTRAQNTPDNPNFVKGYNFMSKGNVDSAKYYIDKSMADSTVRKNATAWYVRGFIYKELHKRYDNPKHSPYRDTSINDLLNSVKIDSSENNRKDCYNTIKFLAASYYNDASSLMDSTNYNQGVTYYRQYRRIMKTIEPGTSLNTMDVSFNLKMGEILSDLFFHCTNDIQKRTYMDSAKKAFNAVLAINPNDISANYSLGILYYNQAVYLINQMDYDAPIEKLNQKQDTSVQLMKQSLPYFKKTYELDPKKKENIEGLKGIYYFLHDTQEYEEYEEKYKELENKQ